MRQEGEGALRRLRMSAVDFYENSAVADGAHRTCPETLHGCFGSIMTHDAHRCGTACRRRTG